MQLRDNQKKIRRGITMLTSNRKMLKKPKQDIILHCTQGNMILFGSYVRLQKKCSANNTCLYTTGACGTTGLFRWQNSAKGISAG